ncbi:hypothetical protein J6590_006237 [Homalodisca vitripennis]|nr:hypothetical protein J6590_006237 [Homalodisca vitripennis]
MAHREGWVVVNQVPTRVQTWGGWIEDPLPDGDSVIVCIPGNPGLTSFYRTFLASLHQQLGIPVWICCQAGRIWGINISHISLEEGEACSIAASPVKAGRGLARLATALRLSLHRMDNIISCLYRPYEITQSCWPIPPPLQVPGISYLSQLLIFLCLEP